jgi:hypothetical protein
MDDESRLVETAKSLVGARVALGYSALPMGVAQRAAAFFVLAWLVIVGWRLCRR